MKDPQQGGHRLRPEWADGRPLGLTHRSIVDAILEATGAARAEWSRVHGRLRDSGAAALALRDAGGGRQRLLVQPAPLSAAGVRASLLSLAELTGAGAERRKSEKLAACFRAARGVEIKWLVRTALPHVAVGISLEASVLPALGAARSRPRRRRRRAAAAAPSAPRGGRRRARGIRHAARCGRRLRRVARRRRRRGVRRACALRAGVPARPMLAKPATSAADLVTRLRAAKPPPPDADGAASSSASAAAVVVAAEHKYDGQRAQLHRADDGTVKIFSRKNDEMTAKFPDVVAAAVASARSQRAFIVDAEICAAGGGGGAEDGAADDASAGAEVGSFPGARDAGTGRQLGAGGAACALRRPRARRRVVVRQTAGARRAALHSEFGRVSGAVEFATATDVDLTDGDAAAALDGALRAAIGAGCEGLMVKRLDWPYECSSSNRSDGWLKLKKDYVEGLGDSLDLVPIGGWRGSGRKKKWVSPWLVAVYDPETETFGSVCRVMSGFTDEFYKENTKRTSAPSSAAATTRRAARRRRTATTRRRRARRATRTTLTARGGGGRAAAAGGGARRRRRASRRASGHPSGLSRPKSGRSAARTSPCRRCTAPRWEWSTRARPLAPLPALHSGRLRVLYKRIADATTPSQLRQRSPCRAGSSPSRRARLECVVRELRVHIAPHAYRASRVNSGRSLFRMPRRPGSRRSASGWLTVTSGDLRVSCRAAGHCAATGSCSTRNAVRSSLHLEALTWVVDDDPLAHFEPSLLRQEARCKLCRIFASPLSLMNWLTRSLNLPSRSFFATMKRSSRRLRSAGSMPTDFAVAEGARCSHLASLDHVT